MWLEGGGECGYEGGECGWREEVSVDMRVGEG